MERPAPDRRRLETDREDLLREATALVERVEIAPLDPAPAECETTPAATHTVIGFRPDGCASFYFGGDRVYHFNSHSELRRAFVDGRLLKAQRGALVSMRRERTGGAVNLVSHVLADAEQEAFLRALAERLLSVRQQLASGRFSIVGQVPAESDVVGRVRRWLEDQGPTVVADSPHAR